MARPRVSLTQWMQENTDMKIAFLNAESQRADGFVKIIEDEKRYRVLTLNVEKLPQEIYPLTYKAPDFLIAIDHSTFEKLKNRFRSYTFQDKNKKQGITKKQISISNQTNKQLEHLIKRHNLINLPNCLDFLINHNNFLINSKDNELKELKGIIKSHMQKIKDLGTNLLYQHKLAKEREKAHYERTAALQDYLKKELIEAKSQCLKFEIYFDSLSELDKSELQSLSKEQSDKLTKSIEAKINEINTSFENEFKTKQQTQYIESLSFTNEAMGFDR